MGQVLYGYGPKSSMRAYRYLQGTTVRGVVGLLV